MQEISLVNIAELQPHEEIDPQYFETLKNKILNLNYWKWPIVIEKENQIILDGHHRYNIAKSLGFTKIPVLSVDYTDAKIQVLSRRATIKISKEIVKEHAKAKKLFPQKTTNHQFLINEKWEPIYKVAPIVKINFEELL